LRSAAFPCDWSGDVLIPSIDLMGGRIVQLEQGEHLRIASDDIDGWVRRFSSFPMVQLIDLDAAVGRGDNAALVRSICRALPCQVGGGIRTVERARELMNDGARRVIAGSALFTSRGVNTGLAAAFAKAIPADAFIGAVDSRGGQVVIHGWQTTLPLTPVEAVGALEPYVGSFLYTHVDTEGLLLGIDIKAVEAVAAATSRRVIAAGGIRSRTEIDTLHARGIDAVVGMAIYQGIIDTEPYSAPRVRCPRECK
jgi:phosphoribosylformimino-5-aminoimidazole carboxamide ribotide isomerase